ncbi:MAG TPA: alpha/beta hydrolase [Solirubrobacteraceae bacterium]|nr:alpha/beta hydrolase [Solirubrobacteraceae bacterium]
MSDAEPLSLRADGTELSGEISGEGVPVVLLHGLTATRRYVVMGSRTLQRSGHRVIAYDARGHGRSGPAAEGDYGYPRLAADLGAVLDAAGVRRAVLAGSSMGAQTAVRFALENPERVAGLVLITPAFDPRRQLGEHEMEGWDALAAGLREGGVDGFVAAYPLDGLAPELRPTVETVLRQRLGAHEQPLAVAVALEAVPRSRPFESADELAALAVPAAVVASRDEADPSHPLAVGEAWAEWIPEARLVVEDEASPPRSPIAWQGGQLSRVIAEVTTDARM